MKQSNNKYYTKEQIKTLEDLDVIQHFKTVTESNFKRGTTTKQDHTVAAIYDKATGIPQSRNFGCSVCLFNLYRDAGNLYFKSKAHYEEYEAKTNKKKNTKKDGNKKQ